MPEPTASRLQHKLILAFVLVMLIPALTLVLYSVQRSSDLLVDHAREERLRLIKAKAAAVEAQLTNAYSDLLFLSQAPEIRRFINATPSSPDAERALDAATRLFQGFLARSSGRYASLCLADGSGQQRACAIMQDGQPIVAPRRENIAARDYFLGALSASALSGANPVYLSEAQLDAVDGRVIRPYTPVIRYSTMLQTDSGMIAGILSLKILLQPIVETAASADVSGTTYIVDTYGQYLAHPDPDRVFGYVKGTGVGLLNDLSLKDADAILRDRAGTLFASAAMPDTLQVFARIRPRGQATLVWTLVNNEPISALLGTTRNTQRVLFGITAISLIAAILVATLLARGIAGPIHDLAEAAEAMSRGELPEHTPQAIFRKDEIGALTLSFSRMAVKIRRLVRDLRKRVSDLERAEAALRASEERYHSLYDNAPSMFFTLAQDGHIVSANAFGASRLGYKPDDLVGRHTLELVPPDDRALTREKLDACLARPGEPMTWELRKLHKNGTPLVIKETARTVFAPDGQIVTLVVCEDITEQKRAQEAVRERDAQLRSLIESNIIGVCFWEMHGGVTEGAITDANDAFLRIIGYTREDLAADGIDWAQVTPPEFREADERAAEEVRRTGRQTPYEKEFIRRDGSRVPVLVGSALLEGRRDKGVGFVIDLTERKQAEQRIQHLAQHDALTGLPNRMLFRDRINQAIAQARRDNGKVGVLFVDLDHFKHINDSLGHHVGDRLLRVAGERLKRCLREGDTVARQGGDEFVIGLPALTDNRDAVAIAEKVLHTLREPFLIDQRELHISGSIGISIYPTDGTDPESLMRAADTAMYHAKERGRDSYQFFHAQLNEAVQRRLAIANLLHRGLEREELSLHYQPQVDMETGRIFAAEALLRWSPPELGELHAQEFVRVAEDTALMVPLGDWVLRSACWQLNRWHAAGYTDLRICVNLSAHQFRRPGLPERTAEILREAQLPPSALEFEITEGVLVMENIDYIKSLNELAALGVRLSVDDFGTGYSSLAYLQRLPLHELKIDQSFVDGIGNDANDSAIVTAIIAMAQNLRLDVIAEGIETRQQIEFLRHYGCLLGQGFYFSRALPADRFTALLRGEIVLPIGVQAL